MVNGAFVRNSVQSPVTEAPVRLIAQPVRLSSTFSSLMREPLKVTVPPVGQSSLEHRGSPTVRHVAPWAWPTAPRQARDDIDGSFHFLRSFHQGKVILELAEIVPPVYVPLIVSTPAAPLEPTVEGNVMVVCVDAPALMVPNETGIESRRWSRSSRRSG